MSTDPSKEDDANADVQWTPSIETMLANWCDKAKCFEWMHNEAYSRYHRRAVIMSITANIAVSLSGVANLIVGGLNPSSVNPPIIFGCISIGLGIINMLQDKLDWLTLSNNFKYGSQQWSVIIRNIEEQLAVPPATRKHCATFLKYIKQQINNVSIHNQSIPKSIRDQCAKKFSTIPNFDIPDICGQIEHTSIYVSPASTTSTESSSITQPLLINTDPQINTTKFLSTMIGPSKGFNLGFH